MVSTEKIYRSVEMGIAETTKLQKLQEKLESISGMMIPMESEKPPRALTEDDLHQYMLDESQLDSEILKKIELERSLPDSSVTKWFDELGKKLDASGNDIDWRTLNDSGENEQVD